MPDDRKLPLLTKLEEHLYRIPKAGFLISWCHRLRKKYYKVRNRRRDERSPSNLCNFERKVYSQFGEDGIIEEIFRRLGEGTRFTVEFGIEDGNECNSRYLIQDRGWSALLMDGSAKFVALAQELYQDKPVVILERFVTVENIGSIFAEAGVPGEFDLLSIDVDGNDFWLWEQILKAHSPRVVVIEYNGRWVPPVEWVMPYDPTHEWDGSVYFGASLQSLANLGARGGYKLVGCSSMGLNAFFVRQDLIGDLFPTVDRSVKYHYAAPRYRPLGFGHPVNARDDTSHIPGSRDSNFGPEPVLEPAVENPKNS
jgi:hypothetical protein